MYKPNRAGVCLPECMGLSAEVEAYVCLPEFTSVIAQAYVRLPECTGVIAQACVCLRECMNV